MSDQQKTPSAPWHLWVVGGLLLIWNSIGAFDYIATTTRYEPYLAGFPKEILDYYFNVPTWMYVMWGGSMLGGFVSAVLLLARRKIVVPVTIFAWVCSLVAAVYTYMNPVPGAGGGIVFYITVLTAVLLIVLYMVWLSRRGVLR